MATSWQARQVWKRFCAWYGADVIERKYGAVVPEDWCGVIDDIPPGKLENVLADVRMKHPSWPPGLPEFEAITRAVNKPVFDGPSPMERLCDFVLKTKPLTAAQLRGPWRFIGAGNVRNGEGFAIAGVIVPADGDRPGYRVMVQDMEAA